MVTFLVGIRPINVMYVGTVRTMLCNMNPHSLLAMLENQPSLFGCDASIELQYFLYLMICRGKLLTDSNCNPTYVVRGTTGATNIHQRCTTMFEHLARS